MGKWKTVMDMRSDGDGFCWGPAGKELSFVEAGGPVKKLKAEFAWFSGLFMGSRVVRCNEREQQGDDILRKEMVIKLWTGLQLSQRNRFGENKQVHVLARE